jgi:dipeptidyl aminopeptidase/acylaminoacyl peptidase
VGDWKALNNDSGMLSQSFSPDELMYAIQTDTVLDVRDRQSGRTSVELSGTGCTQADPAICDSHRRALFGDVERWGGFDCFSPRSSEFRLSIWNLADQQMTDQSSVLLRNLDGIQVTDDGQVLDASSQGETSISNSTWWTSSFNFNGLAEAQDGAIIFTPQRVSLDTKGCYFCGSCSLDPTAMQIDCKSGEFAQRDGALDIKVTSDEIVLQPQGSDPIEVALPAELAEGWDVRVIGYAPTNQTVFYCLDKDQRSQVCHIYAAGSGKTIADPEDIYALRFSDDGNSAAYLNRNQKALCIVNLEKGRVTKIPAYQSRADFVNPVFLSGSTELVYVIQNLNDAELLSLEWVDAGNVNVLRRATLDRDEVGVPESVALNEENDILAIGAQDGRIYLLDEEKGKLITSWQASDEPIIGLTFARSDNLLVSLDGTGRIEFWGIK